MSVKVEHKSYDGVDVCRGVGEYTLPVLPVGTSVYTRPFPPRADAFSCTSGGQDGSLQHTRSGW